MKMMVYDQLPLVTCKLKRGSPPYLHRSSILSFFQVAQRGEALATWVVLEESHSPHPSLCQIQGPHQRLDFLRNPRRHSRRPDPLFVQWNVKGTIHWLINQSEHHLLCLDRRCQSLDRTTARAHAGSASTSTLIHESQIWVGLKGIVRWVSLTKKGIDQHSISCQTIKCYRWRRKTVGAPLSLLSNYLLKVWTRHARPHQFSSSKWRGPLAATTWKNSSRFINLRPRWNGRLHSRLCHF